MKNHSSRKVGKAGGTGFRTPSRFIANNAEASKRFKQPPFVKGKYEK